MITILGAGGFIGSHLVRHVAKLGLDHWAPGRDEPLTGRELGHVVYCIGLTADFRSRPYDAVEAHVCRLLELIRTCSFESLLYLSSARLYLRNASPAREEDVLRFEPLDPEDLYNLSKAAGEALTLSLGPRGRVVRPTNVYGPGQSDTFISILLGEARENGTIALQTALETERDYIRVEDVANLLVKIALNGRERIYNVASGVPVSTNRLVESISALTGCGIHVLPDARKMPFPRIDNERIRTEFGYVPGDVLADLPALIGAGG
jgi:nucleoside-diphosphate-sugar epimerase